MKSVILDIIDERVRQDAKHGPQNWPDGTGRPPDPVTAAASRDRCDRAFENGRGTWRDILQEEVDEAFAEHDLQKLRTELVQVAAVAVNWIEALDRRSKS